MDARLDGLLQLLLQIPAAALVSVLAVAAALENIIPPIPADVVVLFGGFLAGQGAAPVGVVFVAVWLGNVAGALLVYGFGRRFGEAFFAGRWGRFLLQPHQLQRLAKVYRRHGTWIIFVSRFLPMFRAVVPVFAGVARLPLLRTAIPIAVASAVWYGLIVYLGAAAGENWNTIRAQLAGTGRWFWTVAALALLAVAAWWWRSRER